MTYAAQTIDEATPTGAAIAESMNMADYLMDSACDPLVAGEIVEGTFHGSDETGALIAIDGRGEGIVAPWEMQTLSVHGSPQLAFGEKVHVRVLRAQP